jgi:4-alpha-glucanotransferase
MERRGSGILLHITSLPASHGIGDLGPAAYRFVDFLAQARQSYWQILPLNPTSLGSGNCPYNSPSAFAGNPLLISADLLAQEGWLEPSDLAEIPSFPAGRVDYDAALRYEIKLLDKAYERGKERLSDDTAFARFCRESATWLDDYSLFVALKAHFHDASWTDWPVELRDRESGALKRWALRLHQEIERERFRQFLFFHQWSALKRYCRTKNLYVIGDLPIYVSHDSADVWANPEIFKLDDSKRPAVVAGVPPDYFSATGQLWGNPLYNWETLQAEGYRWWMRRLSHNLSCFDKIRLDHFRGLVACWEVAAGETTAVRGRWVKAAPEDFFATIVKEHPPFSILAEDLGIITPDVREVMARFGFPGMKVLLFAFGGDMATHPYAPHNYPRDCVVYTGTHDNNTILGWFREEAGVEERRRLSNYLGREVTEEKVADEITRLALTSPADIAIIPLPDILGLGAEARMNRPGTTHGNWQWRVRAEQLTRALAERLRSMTESSGRAPA